MATTSATTNVQGINSGIQWNDIVDSTIRAEEARSVTKFTAQIDLKSKQKDAWATFSTLVQTLNDAARLVRRSGLGGFSATAPASPTTSRTLFSASTSLAASPGRYKVEVQQLAETAKIGGGAVPNTAAALNLAGTLSINGTSITAVATDTLGDIRDKINAVNTGSGATGVTASILSDGSTGGRLVLTRDTSGSSGITLTDGTGGLARELGLIDSRSKPISSATQAAAAALGLSVYPSPASIRVGNIVITADLAVESIATIAAKINAAGGSASVESEPYGDQTRYRLVADGNVSAVPSDSGSQDVIDALGFTGGTTGAIKQSVATGAFTSASNATATSATALAGIKLDGAATGLAVGDAINIRGLRGDGTAVTFGLVVGAGDTVQTLLDRINDQTSGFGSGARSATASIGSDGKIRLVDSTGGASRLSLSLGVTHADGSSGTLGTPTVGTLGRSRQLQTGKDAVVNIDGTLLTRPTNNITDGINGVTLTLNAAEVGTAVDLTVDRDTKSSLDSITKLRDAYNATRTFLDQQRVSGAALYANSSLRDVVSSFTAAMRTNVSSNSTYTNLSVTGLSLDRFGQMQIDTATLNKALQSKPAEVEALFGFSGVGAALVTATDAATGYGTGTIATQQQSISDSTERLKQRVTSAQARLDAKRIELVARYAKMETLLSSLQSQSSSISSLTKSLNG